MANSDNFLDDHTFLGDGEPDTLDQRLARELPDGENARIPFERQPDAVGELVAEPSEDEDGIPTEQVVLASESGPAREGAPAEQRAMHIVDLEDEWAGMPQEDYSSFEEDPNAPDSLDEDDEPEDADSADSPDEADEGAQRFDDGDMRRDDAADEFIFDPEYDDDYVPQDDA